jgi:hypothetical protein
VTPQEITIGISLITVSSAAVNVYVGLRLAAMQAKMQADTSALEVAIVKQFAGWKDEVLAAINGKYVSAQLIAEIRASLGREMNGLLARMDHIEKRCEDRPKDCIALRCHPPG